MPARFIIVMLIGLAAAVDTAAAQQDHEAALKQRYDSFVKSLNHRRLAEDYLGAMRNLDSPEPRKQIIGIKTLAATEELQAIPWIVPFLDSEDRHVRIQAGLNLNAIVATHQLKRRDKSHPEKVVILPPDPGDIDLKPMSWVILKMLRKPDDGNTHAYAANMVGYLGLKEFEGELRNLLDSKHPAVTQAARRALEMLRASKDGKNEASLDDLVEQLRKLGLLITHSALIPERRASYLTAKAASSAPAPRRRRTPYQATGRSPPGR